MQKAMKALDNIESSVLGSVIELSDFGFKMFPTHSVSENLCTCRKVNCKSPGKHPKLNNWKAIATDDKARLANLFKDNNSNIGIVTGVKSNLVVIDVDPKNGGLDSYIELINKFGNIEKQTLVSNTSAGGYHVYFKYSGNIKCSNSTVFGPGIDVKGNGGYVIAPPSQHISGAQYCWRNGLIDPAELPKNIEDYILNHQNQKHKDERGYCKTDQSRSQRYDENDVCEGQRNIRLASIADEKGQKD